MPDPDQSTLARREAIRSFARAVKLAEAAGLDHLEMADITAKMLAGEFNTPPLEPVEAYYFGCWRVSGHGIYDINMKSVLYRYPRAGDPLLVPWKQIDGGLIPDGTAQQSAVHLHHRADWTAIAFCDYSVDSRPGSNAAFFFKQPHMSYEESLERARATWPQIVKRIEAAGEFTLVQVTSDVE